MKICTHGDDGEESGKKHVMSNPRNAGYEQ